MKNSGNLLFYIFLVALLIRVAGLMHGNPFVFHPDEPTIVRSALGVRFNPNPKHFDWPHLYIYLNFFLFMGFDLFRKSLFLIDHIEFVRRTMAVLFDDTFIFYAVSRLLTATLGALTVLPIYLAAKAVSGPKAGLIASLAFAFIPFHVRHSHYALADVPMTFFLAWGLYFSIKLLFEESYKNYMLAGMFVGLAASSKYNGGLSCMSVAFAALFNSKADCEKESVNASKNRLTLFISKLINRLPFLLLSGVSCIFGFLLGTPFALLDFDTFSRTDGPAGAFWQFTNVGSTPFGEHLYAFITNFFTKIADDVGYTILLVYLGTLTFLILNSLIRRFSSQENQNSFPALDKHLWFLLIPSLILFYYISGFEKDRSHYFLIVYPYLAVIFGLSINALCSIVDRKIKHLSFIVILFLLIPPMYLSLKEAEQFTRGDTRQAFYNWALQTDFISTANSEKLIYFDSSMKPVLEKLELKASKGYKDLLTSPSGYIITYNDGDFSEGTVRKVARELEVFKKFSNENSLGPEVVIYRYVL